MAHSKRCWGFHFGTFSSRWQHGQHETHTWASRLKRFRCAVLLRTPVFFKGFLRILLSYTELHYSGCSPESPHRHRGHLIYHVLPEVSVCEQLGESAGHNGRVFPPQRSLFSLNVAEGFGQATVIHRAWCSRQTVLLYSFTFYINYYTVFYLQKKYSQGLHRLVNEDFHCFYFSKKVKLHIEKCI